MSAIKQEWISAICDFAASEPLIEKIYIFGSRARNEAREDSDLDLGLFLTGQSHGEKMANWFFEKQRWHEILSKQIPVKLDLQCALSDDAVVMPAVLDHGILIYQAA